MNTTAPAISTDRLTKRYGGRVAVDNLSMDIPRGAVAGFIGPNGAGKTTTMAMLLGLVRPTSGEASVLGEPIQRPEHYISRVGALLEGPALWPALTAVENMRVIARLGGYDDRRIPEVLQLVGLGERADDRFGQYSLGMKQRLGIAAALLGDPQLLILDEPTNGLDPAGMSDMRDLIARIVAEDRTVLVSSHMLSELEQICDWLFILERGRLIFAGKSEEFAADTGTEILLGPARSDDLLPLADVIAAEGLDAGRDGEHLVVSVNGDNPRLLASSLNSAAATAGIILAELHVRRPTLEANYLRLLKEESS